MKQDMKNNTNMANRIIGQLVAERRKTVFAVCLIALVVFMLARVVGERVPQTAEAVGQKTPAIVASEPEPQLKITFIELPKVAGRNTEITRDFFALDSWKNLTIAGESGK